MSGIVATLHLDGAPTDPALLQQLTAVLSFRGPDGQMTWHAGPIGMGQALWRTSMPGQQELLPYSVDGHTWIVADARIDGRRELVAELTAKGSVVTDEISDVALILLAYKQWGDACLDHLIGDFVFILWDDLEQRLFCAHDHFGVRPLYYATAGRTLVLSNTVNCIRLHPGVPDTLNEQAIGDFLLFNLNIDLAETTFASVHRLPPAHSLTVTDGDNDHLCGVGPATEPYRALNAGRCTYDNGYTRTREGTEPGIRSRSGHKHSQPGRFCFRRGER